MFSILKFRMTGLKKQLRVAIQLKISQNEFLISSFSSHLIINDDCPVDHTLEVSDIIINNQSMSSLSLCPSSHIVLKVIWKLVKWII